MNGRVISPVALVVPDAGVRADLTRYLTQAGFEVHGSAEPPGDSPTAWSLVWVTERDHAPSQIESVVCGWLQAPGPRRAVLISWRPAAVRHLIEALDRRLVILTPPVFAWDLVDALRPGVE